MAGTVVGSAEFLLTVNQQGLITGIQQAQSTAQSGSARIQQAIDGNLKKSEESAKRFGESFKKSLELGGAIVGVQASLEGLAKGFERIVEVTKESEQAQLGLSKTYGAGAAQFNEFAKQMAAATGQSALEFQKAGAEARGLATNYGLTNQQIQELIKRSADLAAISGTTVSDAFHRIRSALDGETQSADALGLSLNQNVIEATAKMTDEQRKHFQTLDQVTKARIVANEILRQSAADEGAAAQNAGTLTRALAEAEGAAASTALIIGTKLTPAIVSITESFGPIPEAVNGVIQAIERLNEVKLPDWMDPSKAGRAATGGVSLFERIFGRKFGEAGPDETLIGPGGKWIDTTPTASADAQAGFPVLPNGRQGPVLSTEGRDALAAAQEAQRIQNANDLVAQSEAKRRAKETLDQREKDVKARADAAIKGIEREKKAADDAYQTQRALTEQAKNAEIKAAEDSRDGQIKAIDEEAKATAKRYDDAIRDAERARDGEKKASEDTRDAALKGLEAEQQAAHDANDAQIRDQEILRDHAKQAAEDQRDNALKSLDTEKRARDNARITEDRNLEDQTKAAQRELDKQATAAEKRFDREAKAAEKAHDKKVRALEDESNRAEKAHDKAISRIEKQSQKEDDRHTKMLRALQDEEDARLGILDAQLKALDAADKQVAAAERLAKLNKTAADARDALTKATGTGTPAEIAAARGELVTAHRVGDSISIANAEQRLKQLAGQGPEAVKKAQDDLTDALAAIQKEQTDQARDAQREQLDAAKDTIKAEIDARKQQEDDQNAGRKRQLDADKQAADDRLKRVKESVAVEKQAADDRYKTAKDGIDKRKADEKDAHDLLVQQSKDATEKAKRDVEDRRRSEDQADTDKRREITDTYDLEQRKIKATYDDEETGVIPALRRAREAADREYKAKRETIEATYKDEQEQIAATYDGPDGLIQRTKDQASDAATEYGKRKEAVNDAYNAERDRIKEVYDDPVHGLLAVQAQAHKDIIDNLDAQKIRWQTWETDTVKNIQEALNKLDEFLTKVGALDKLGTVDIDGNPVGAGPNPGGRQGGPGGDLAYGPVVRNASPDSYWTSGGTHGGHPAADIFAPPGSPIYAPVGGSESAGSGSLGGNYGILTGDDGRSYYFAHGRIPFESGRVEQGQQIGEVGNTGNAASTASHVHFAIASNSGVFGELNGSGDIEGDSSYWGEGGTANSRGGDEEIEIDILGRKLRVRTSGANIPGEVGQWIREGIKLAGVPSSWAKPLAEIAAAESGQRNADGSVVIGTGSATAGNPELVDGESATGLMQTLPSTFAAYAVPGHTDIYDPVANVAAAARYIQAKAVYGGTPWGTPYYRTGAFDWRNVDGYRDGGMIREPTLLAGLVTGRLGIAGETGQPERLLGVDETRAGAQRGGDSTVINVTGIGLDEVAADIERRQNRQRLLRGVAGTVRRR